MKATVYLHPGRRPSTSGRLHLWRDLQRQLPRTRGSMRRHTEEAIRQLEIEISGRASIRGEKATRG